MWLVGLLVLAALTLLAARADAKSDPDLALAPQADAVDDADLDPDPITDLGPGNDVSDPDAEGVLIDDVGNEAWASGLAGADEQDEEAARQHQRSTGWGRLDVSLAWRHHDTITSSGERVRDELWLFAAWSR